MLDKGIFVTSFDKNEAAMQEIFKQANSYGFSVNGHFWKKEDDITKELPSKELESAKAWVIYAPNDLGKDEQIALSFTILALRNFSKNKVPIFIIGKEQPLPTLVNYAEFITADKLGVKLAAKTNIKKSWNEEDFRISAHVQAGIGVWLEVGPSKDSWKGVVVGVNESDDAKIDFQAVGNARCLPEKTTLNFPFKDAVLESNGNKFISYGCQNELQVGQSYFVRIKGRAEKILIGQGLTQEDELECYMLKLTV